MVLPVVLPVVLAMRPEMSIKGYVNLIGVLATIGSASALVSCDGSGGGEARTSARDSVILAIRPEPPGLDPTTGSAAAIGSMTVTSIFEGLTRVNEAGDVLPGLAQAWTISDDATHYTFHLEENVVFSDGTAFDADDVKFTFTRNAGADSTSKRKAYFTQMTSIETPDPFTVEITIARPNAFFLFNLAEPVSAIVAPESAATNRISPVGTGPYMLARWQQGSRVQLVANPLYRRPEQVRIKNVEFRFIEDPASQVAAMLAEEIDAILYLEAKEAVSQFENDDRFDTIIGTTEGETILAMNNARAPLDDVRVRRAISLAIDRQAVIDGAEFGYGIPIGSHFAPHHPDHIDLTGVYPFDPVAARRLLDEAGYDEIELTLKVPTFSYTRRSAEIIASQLSKVGITASIEPLEFANWLETVYRQRAYDLSIVAHVEPLDIEIYANPDYYFQYDSAAFREIWASAISATTPEDRHDKLVQAQRKLSEDAVNGFLFQLAQVVIKKKELKGLWRNAPMSVNNLAGLYWAP